MTQRVRSAIVHYWLTKQLAGLSPQSLRRLLSRNLSHFFVFALTISLCTCAYAKDLVSMEAAPVPAESKVKPVQAAAKPAQTAKSSSQTKTPAGQKKNAAELPEVDAKDEKAEGMIEHARGSVTGKTRFGIAVVTGTDPEKGDIEVWMDFNRSTKFTGYKDPSAIQEGDIVSLTYKEIKTDPKKKTSRKWILKEVAFIQKKPKEAPVSELLEPAAVKP